MKTLHSNLPEERKGKCFANLKIIDSVDRNVSRNEDVVSTRDTSNLCWFNGGPMSQTLAQH